MNEYVQIIKITCQNNVIKGSIKASEGHPWRNWKVRIVGLENSREKKGKLNYILDHVEYNLHPTFDNPKRVLTKEPYFIQERGWGEFDMRVELFFKNNLAPPENIFFDLHFREHTYHIYHKIVFVNPSPELIQLLMAEVPPFEYGIPIDHKRRKTSPPLGSFKKMKTPPPYDGPLTPSNLDSDDLYRAIHGHRLQQKSNVIIDDIYSEKDLQSINPIHSKPLDDQTRMAWGIPDGLDILELAKRLTVLAPEQIQEIESIIVNNKKDDMIFEEDDEEFMIDLYSLGPNLLALLWEYTEKKKNTTMLSPFSLVQANTNLAEDERFFF